MLSRKLETVRSLKKEMATHSNNLAWRIPWTEETGRLQFMALQGLDITEQLNHHHFKDYMVSDPRSIPKHS